MTTHFDFPYRVGADGRTGSTEPDRHVATLVELVLFTDAGARINRPEFGAGFSRGVADPSTGRLGYDLQRPSAAVELIEDRHLPFAVCGD